jgi:hypothetical protein
MSETPFGVSVLVEPWKLGLAVATVVLRWWPRTRSTRIVVTPMSDDWLIQHDSDSGKHRDEP